MSSRRWAHVRAIFDRVREVPTKERRALLDSLCAGDASLREEVASLLEHVVDDDSFLARPALGRALVDEVSLPEVQDERVRTNPCEGLGRDQIGRYRLIRKLGEGGMGVVYEAEQQEPKRLVALKIVRAGPGDSEALQRFRREAETLARLRHPGIARIVEAGREADGVHWIAMELVEGRPLGRWLAEEQPKQAQIVELFARICDAVHAAHVRGVVHRDLKASNIMVERDATPRILDFGLARVQEMGLATIIREPVTRTGRLFGTLTAMSPEQACGHPDDVDLRSDIYALGLLLYEALTGRSACQIEGLALPEAVRAIRDELPVPPSRINPALRGDLETIILTALEKSPLRRYQSAAACAADLRAFLAGEPIAARRPTTLYLVRKLIARHRRVAIVATIASFACVLFLVTVMAMSVQLALSRAAEADASARLADRLYLSQIARAEFLLSAARTPEARDVLESCEPTRRAWEWHWLWSQIPRPVLANIAPEARVLDVRLEGDRTEVLVAAENDVWIVDDRGQRVDSPLWKEQATGIASAGALVGDDSIVLAYRTISGVVTLERSSPETRHWSTVLPVERVDRLELSPDRAWLVATETTSDPTRLGHVGAVVIRLADGQVVTRARALGYVTGIAWDTSSRRLALAGMERAIAVVTLPAGTLELVPTRAPVRALAYFGEGDAERLLIASSSNRVEAFPSKDADPSFGPLAHGVTALVTEPTGRVIAASAGGEIVGWEFNGRRSVAFSVEGSGPTKIGVSRDGTRLWTLRRDAGVSVWPLPPIGERALDRDQVGGAVGGLRERRTAGGGTVLTEDGRSLVRLEHDAVVWLDGTTLAVRGSRPTRGYTALAAIDGTKILASAGRELWSVTPEEERQVAVMDDEILSIVVLPMVGQVVVLESSGALTSWRITPEGTIDGAQPSRVLPPFLATEEPILAAGAEDLVVVATRRGVLIEVALPASGEIQRRERATGVESISALAVDRTGRIAIGTTDGHLRLYPRAGDGGPPASVVPLWSVRSHELRVTGIAFGPRPIGEVTEDAEAMSLERITSTSLDKSVRVRRTIDGELMLTIPSRSSPLLGVVVTGDNALIECAGGSVRRLDALGEG